jgi:hypothetical protein
MDKPNISAALQFAKERLKINIGAGAFGAEMGHTKRIWDLRHLAYSNCFREGCDPDHLVPEDFRIVPNEEFIEKMVGWARDGDQDSHRIVCEVLRHLIEDGEPPLPRCLREYLIEFLKAEFDAPDESGPGWDPAGRYARDHCIRLVVEELVAAHGLSRTRNPATAKPSACSIVSDVLGELGMSISEKTIAAITKPFETD